MFCFFFLRPTLIADPSRCPGTVRKVPVVIFCVCVLHWHSSQQLCQCKDAPLGIISEVSIDLSSRFQDTNCSYALTDGLIHPCSFRVAAACWVNGGYVTRKRRAGPILSFQSVSRRRSFFGASGSKKMIILQLLPAALQTGSSLVGCYWFI